MREPGGSVGRPGRSQVDSDQWSAPRQAPAAALATLPAAVGPLAAGLLVGAWVACFRSYGIFDFADEGAQLMQALRVARGERPYLDFATGYGPIQFAIQGE